MNKWIIILLILIVLVFGIAVFKKEKNQEIKSFKFVEIYNDATTPLQIIRRGENPFDFLFAFDSKSPFTFNVNLGKPAKPDIWSVWIYASKAFDHSHITIQYEGKTVGIVNNQIPGPPAEPLPTLSYVGDIDVTDQDIILKIIAANDTRPNHYSELGLIILAPPGMAGENIAALLKKDGQIM